MKVNYDWDEISKTPMDRFLLKNILYFSDFSDMNIEELWLYFYKHFILDFFVSDETNKTAKEIIEKYIKDKDEDFIIYFNDKFNKYLEKIIDDFIFENPKEMFFGINDEGFMDDQNVSYDTIYKIFKDEDCIKNINKLFKYEFLDKDKVIEYYKIAYKK